jgi:hypothetical protein
LVGRHEVEIHLHSELNVTIKVNVVGDDADAELIQELVGEEQEEQADEKTDAAADKPSEDTE